MGGRLVPLEPMYDGQHVLLPGHIQVDDAHGGTFMSGDVWPDLLRPTPLTWDLFVELGVRPLSNLFDPRTDDILDFFLRAALFKLAADDDGLFGEVPDGACVLFEHWQQQQNFGPVPPDDGNLCQHPDGINRRTKTFWWQMTSPPPRFFVLQGFIFCLGNFTKKEGITLDGVHDISSIFGDAGHEYFPHLGYKIATKWVLNCSDTSDPQEIPMPDPAYVPQLPDDVPPPPPPPNAVPKLYGGVVTSVDDPDLARTTFTSHLDGYILDLSVFCPCTDGAPGADGPAGPAGPEGPAGPPGTGTGDMLTPFTYEAPLPDATGKKLVKRTVNLYACGDGTNSTVLLYSIMLDLLQRILVNFERSEGEKSGTGEWYPRDGVPLGESDTDIGVG